MNSEKITTITGTVLDDEVVFSLSEIAHVTHMDPALIVELVEYHVIEPAGTAESDWQFDHVCLKRVKLARNFYHDLEVNMPGIALILDMLEKIESLESELARLR